MITATRSPSGLLCFSILCVALSVGCSSDVNVEGGGGEGGGSGGEGGEGGSGAGNPVCAAFADQESAGDVTFTVVNQSGQDVYLRGSCDAINYSVDPEDGPDGTFYGDVGGSCQQSCEALQTEDQLLCEADACAPSSILVQDGETREIRWGGLGQKSVEMPAECWFSESSGTSCQQYVAAEAGSYDLKLGAFSDCGEDCVCDVNGACTGDATGVEAVANEATFDFPASGPVEIVFDTCAFGCAGGG